MKIETYPMYFLSQCIVRRSSTQFITLNNNIFSSNRSVIRKIIYQKNYAQKNNILRKLYIDNGNIYNLVSISIKFEG
jgi:hypothetical protein